MPDQAAKKRILIVEDEPTVADTLAIIFRTRGYEVRVAYRAEVAIDILSEWQPHVAIVDVMLPGMSGIDFAIVLRQSYPQCGVLLFSGQPDTSRLIEEALRRGHRFEVLAKPLHPSLILEKVAKLLAGAKAHLDEL